MIESKLSIQVIFNGTDKALETLFTMTKQIKNLEREYQQKSKVFTNQQK